MIIFIIQLYDPYITGRTSFIKWMFSNEGLGIWDSSTATGQRRG